MAKDLAHGVHLGAGLLRTHAPIEPLLRSGRRIAIISDQNVAPLYAQALLEKLKSSGASAQLFTVIAGEKAKTRAVKADLEDQLFAGGFGRDSMVVAVGGGVLTDLAGFVAATYCRGVPLCNIPTSLVGMVDAALGGKTGINLPKAKNFIGSFYPAWKIYIDPELLLSLPIEIFRDGMGEVIKHALIHSEASLAFLRANSHELKGRSLSLLEQLLEESCQVKLRVVAQDRRESGVRRILNFGHTVAHAIESVNHYRISHGQAVAIGCVVEACLSIEYGDLTLDAVRTIADLFRAYGFSLRSPILPSLDELYEAMIQDKKSVGGVPRFVLLKSVGTPLDFSGSYCTPLDKATFFKAMEKLPGDLCQCFRT